MMRRFLMWTLVFALAGLQAGEAPQNDDAAFAEARVLTELGDVRGALPIIFRLLRTSATEDMRSNARSYLDHMGMTAQEVFQLDPAAMKPEDLDKLAARLGVARVQLERAQLDIQYAQSLLRLAVQPRMNAAGEIQVAVQAREIQTALEMLLELALSTLAENDTALQAQRVLENMSIAGARVEAVRKEIAAGALSPQTLDEATCGVCLVALEQYRGWAEQQDQSPDSVARRRYAKRIGPALFMYLQKQYAKAPQLRELLQQRNIWREPVAPPHADSRF